MIGPLEIAIVVIVLLVIFFHRRIPALARGAGERIRNVRGSAQGSVADNVDRLQAAVGEKVDPKAIARSAGRGAREVRELRDAVAGVGDPKPAEEPQATEKPREGSDPV